MGYDMKYGLLGRKLGHSFSKKIHNLIDRYDYDLYEKELDQIEQFVNGDITGFNITIPYKIEVMKYIDEMTNRAKKIGCINTVIKKNGKVIGDNTDYFGFEYMLNSLEIGDVKSALILGDGATSMTVGAVLDDRGIPYTKLSRKTEPYYSRYLDYKDVELLINATPVGMYPNNGERLIDISEFNNLKGVIDVVYNPMCTKLLFDAKEKNIKCCNGLPMLVAQAAEAYNVFCGNKVEDRKMKRIIEKLSVEGNIVLIGMPSTGKSTIGRIISKNTDKILVDFDEEIVRKTGKSIERIFSEDGEAYFRKLESEMCREFGKKNNLVIATGGGVVTQIENYEHLKQNGKIYLLKRNLEELELEGRPLLKDFDSVLRLWEDRKDRYQSFSDKEVENITIMEASKKIVDDFYGYDYTKCENRI